MIGFPTAEKQISYANSTHRLYASHLLTRQLTQLFQALRCTTRYQHFLLLIQTYHTTQTKFQFMTCHLCYLEHGAVDDESKTEKSSSARRRESKALVAHFGLLIEIT